MKRILFILCMAISCFLGYAQRYNVNSSNVTFFMKAGYTGQDWTKNTSGAGSPYVVIDKGNGYSFVNVSSYNINRIRTDVDYVTEVLNENINKAANKSVHKYDSNVSNSKWKVYSYRCVHDRTPKYERTPFGFMPTFQTFCNMQNPPKDYTSYIAFSRSSGAIKIWKEYDDGSVEKPVTLMPAEFSDMLPQSASRDFLE